MINKHNDLFKLGKVTFMLAHNDFSDKTDKELTCFLGNRELNESLSIENIIAPSSIETPLLVKRDQIKTPSVDWRNTPCKIEPTDLSLFSKTFCHQRSNLTFQRWFFEFFYAKKKSK